MRYRLLEEHCPVRDASIYWTQRKILGLWWWPVDGSVSHDPIEARQRYDRIVAWGAKKKYFVKCEAV